MRYRALNRIKMCEKGMPNRGEYGESWVFVDRMGVGCRREVLGNVSNRLSDKMMKSLNV